ncbi:MAG: TetR/AcrR family transcriptional regulator [Marmoricola sp.]
MKQADDMREQVLAAARRVLANGGYGSDRLHAAIAREAGVSRPTVYKYGGSLTEIRAAVIDRETDDLLREITRNSAPAEVSIDYLIELTALAVVHARRHPLIRAGMRDARAELLSQVTVEARTVVARASSLAEPLFAAAIAAGDITLDDFQFMVELMCRVGISLTFIETGPEMDDRDSVISYLNRCLAFVSPDRG